MKICSKCKISQEISNFRKDASRKGGYSYLCKDCDKKRDKIHYVKNADKKRKQGIEYYWRDAEKHRQNKKSRYWNDPEFYRGQDRFFYLQNQEKMREKTKNWRKNNHTRVISYNSMRRSEKLNATPLWLSSIQLAQIQEFYDIAKAKTVQTGVKFVVDHIHPLKGVGFSGMHVPWNLQVITDSENNRKRNKMPISDKCLEWSK